jgi:hypothetical protein
MKTKKLIRFGILLIVITGFAFTGCKKDKTSDPTTNTQSLQNLSKDEVTITQASDDALNDVNTVLSGGNDKSTETLWPCNATIDSVTVDNDSITYHIRYHGWNCPLTRYRVGLVEVTRKLGQQWGEPGAASHVKLINFQITKRNGRSMKLNGSKVFTNVNGGYIWQLGNGQSSIVHRAVGSLQATFEDSTTRTWNFSRQRTFTGSMGQLVMTIEGLGNADGYDSLSTWGTNRNGEAFYTQILLPVVHKQVCDWDPIYGIKVHQIPSDLKKATLTFGYDGNNQPVPYGDCAGYFKVDWVKGPHSGTFFLPLP